MKRINCLLAVVALGFASSAWAGDDVYTLGFDTPTDVSGSPGSDYNAAVLQTLSHVGPGPGAQGFSLSIAAENAAITGITFGGTDTEDLFAGGFSQQGDAADAEHDGVVIAVVLCFGCPNVLAAEASIAVFDLTATFPAAGETDTARVFNKDGLQGAGQPVDNIITQLGQSFPPELSEVNINLTGADEPCTDIYYIGFSEAPVFSETPFDGILGGDFPNNCDANGAGISATVDAGQTGSTEIYANVISNGSTLGCQGWSLSVETEDGGDAEIAIVAVTTDGTPIKDQPGRFQGGFENTSLALPDNKENNGRAGAVSAIVMCFGCPNTLALTGTETVLALTVESVGVAPENEGEKPVNFASGRLFFNDGLVGEGQPVANVITEAGESKDAGNAATADASVSFLAAPVIRDTRMPFVRGNANDDAKIDIADPIWLISELFRGGPPSPCQDAADANDNEVLEIGDATMMINYLFLGGAAPSAPFPGCDLDPNEDAEGELGCAGSSICP